MKHRYLTLAVSVALLHAATCSASSVVIPLSPLPHAEMAAALVPGATPDTADTRITRAFDGRVAWIHEHDLDDPAVRRHAHAALDAGLFVLVTATGAHRSNGSNIFGIEATSQRTVYHRQAGGKLEAASVADTLMPSEASTLIADWIDQRTVRPAITSRFARLMNGPGAQSTYHPRKEFSKTEFFSNGRSIEYDVAVVRQIRAGNDDKVISIKTTTINRPTSNGAWNGQPNVDRGRLLIIPQKYVVLTSVQPVGDTADIQLDQAQPMGRGPSSEQITYETEVQTQAGSNTTGKIVDFLSGFVDGPKGALAKLPVLFSTPSDQRTERKSSTTTLTDYGVELTKLKAPNGAEQAMWIYELDRSIQLDNSRFEDGKDGQYKNYSMKKSTPMMRAATLTTLSTWNVPGHWRGSVDLTTRATIQNIQFRDPKLGAPIFSADKRDDIHVTYRVDLDSPLLARQPVVRLQSRAMDGFCLTQPDASSSRIDLAECDAGESGPEQQWMLDEERRYHNRASNHCLTVNRQTGDITATTCKSGLNQQWTWAADRIVAGINGGNSERLHVLHGELSGRFIESAHDLVEFNPRHELLKPWSNYPEAPRAGSLIPNPEGKSDPVPPYYLQFKRVSDGERWIIKPVMNEL